MGVVEDRRQAVDVHLERHLSQGSDSPTGVVVLYRGWTICSGWLEGYRNLLASVWLRIPRGTFPLGHEVHSGAGGEMKFIQYLAKVLFEGVVIALAVGVALWYISRYLGGL